MSQYGYALLGLTALLAMMVAILTFAVLRFGAAARDTRRHLREGGAETAFLTAALQDAVSKLKAQEQAMSARAAASERLSGEIVASLTAGLLVVDADGRINILNPAGRRMLGLPEAASPAHVGDALVSAQPLAAVIEECLATGQPIVRRALQMPTGLRVSHFGVTVSPLTGERGQQGAICLFSDLTAVVELEEQLRLKDTLARLGELTAGIAHEFRNGLATIHGYARLMDPNALPGAYRPYVEGIRGETEALGRVVTNFLNFAKPEQVTLAPVDTAALATRAADDARHELGSPESVRVTGRFAVVQADDVLLRQALNNLLRNAIEACQAAGRTPAIVVHGEVDRNDGWCRIAVQDNGPGFDAEARDHVFRPFFTTKSHGTGLGLAIVQKIAVTHNGRVSIGESPLGGASVVLALPLREP